MVADAGLLAPHRLPSLVESAVCLVFEDKGVRQVIAPLKDEAHTGGQHHGLAVAIECIGGHAIDHRKLEFQLPIGTLQGDGIFQ